MNIYARMYHQHISYHTKIKNIPFHLNIDFRVDIYEVGESLYIYHNKKIQ